MKVVFDIQAGRIAIEGDGADLLNILQAARELAPHVTQIQITADAVPSAPAAAETPKAVSLGSGERTQTMRQFARSLTLTNAAERIAALGYYANKLEGKPTFSPKDMDGWFTMCGFQKPSQMPVALFDTKRNYGYLENVSRGNWRISNQGENLIIGKIEDRQNE
jgi:hypothetical protein